MKSLKLVLFIVVILSNLGFSQVKSLGIIDSKTNKKIPFVNVVIKNSKIGWSGDERGNVKINFTKIDLKDSLVFSAVGYERKTLEYSLVHTLSKIKLTPNLIYLDEFKIKTQKYRRARLGRKKVDKSSFKRGSGLTRNRSQKMEAKYIPNDIGSDGIIKVIRIFIRFGSEFPFEVDVLDVNEINGSPAKSLLKKPIECVAKKNNKWLTVKVKKHNIHLPENGFFIAINWRLDSALNSTEKFHTYKMHYAEEKKPRIDTLFYRATIVGNYYEKETNWWLYNDSTWENYWSKSINFRDTCISCLKSNPDLKKWDLRTSGKATLSVYANILYSKSAKKYVENILDKEGIVTGKDKIKLLSNKFEYPKREELLYKQGDVYQLFESIKRALDSNKMNYIAHHLLSYTYESIEDFNLDLNKNRRGKIIYEIEEVLKNKEKIILTKKGNGLYDFYYSPKIGGKLILREGSWTMLVEIKTQGT